MNDPRSKPMQDLKAMSFDGKRLIYGGFTTLLRAGEMAR